MTAYYNEHDPYAAQWLRNLIAAGHIAPGVVDDRSIEDVRPSDLGGFTQCHFFAGIGVWSLALRRAGWPNDRSVWTGSCPCQPFSTAGNRSGFDDERHLWPAFFHLIEQCRPAAVFGEQVAGRDADAWIDLVQDDLEGLGYRVGAVAFPSASIGAPHIRDRLFWVAHSECAGIRGRGPGSSAATQTRMQRAHGQRQRVRTGARSGGAAVALGLGDTERYGLRGSGRAAADLTHESGDRSVHGQALAGAGPVNGFWRVADWLACRDGKWRPVEPGAFPLADGAPARVGRLRAYGNAINAVQAQAFIEAVMEAA